MKLRITLWLKTAWLKVIKLFPTTDPKFIAGAACLVVFATGFILYTVAVFLYFFEIYHCLPQPWPIDAWWGIPAFSVYTLMATVWGTMGVRIMLASVNQFYAKVFGIKIVEKSVAPAVPAR